VVPTVVVRFHPPSSPSTIVRVSAPYSRITVAPSPALSGTQLTVLADDGAKFPTPPFIALAWPIQTQPDATNSEELTVSAVVGDTLFFDRAAAPIAITDSMQIAALRAVPTLRLGESIRLEISYSVADPPYTLRLSDPSGAVAEYAGSATLDSLSRPVYQYELAPQRGGMWFYRWETGPLASAGPDASFFVQYTDAR
jgi:hypothetical protein